MRGASGVYAEYVSGGRWAVLLAQNRLLLPRLEYKSSRQKEKENRPTFATPTLKTVARARQAARRSPMVALEKNRGSACQLRLGGAHRDATA
jgi:hypothetical protein